MRDVRAEHGFSLIELSVASALLMLVMSSVFQALHPAHAAFQAEPERADVQQRLRAGLSAATEVLSPAGAGVTQGPSPGPLIGHTAAVFPYRLGRRTPDPAGSARPDAITILNVEPGGSQTTLAQPLAAASGDAVIALDSGCPSLNPACGFESGAMVLVLGGGGRFDLFTVRSVAAQTLTLEHNSADSPYVYPTGSLIVRARSRTLYLRADPANGLYQLMRYDGDNGRDVPVADHVVALTFGYRGEAEPPRRLPPPAGVPGDWASYGPPPPASTLTSTDYPPGENCLFQRDAAANPVSRLETIDVSSTVALPLARFTDGPWCADGSDPNRFDADLLRIRTVSITMRVQAGNASLRGTGPQFFNAGTARSALRLVPDAEATMEFAPVNLNPGRR